MSHTGSLSAAAFEVRRPLYYGRPARQQSKFPGRHVRLRGRRRRRIELKARFELLPLMSDQ